MYEPCGPVTLNFFNCRKGVKRHGVQDCYVEGDSERMQVESPGIGRPDGFSEIEYVVHPIRMFHIKYVFYKRKC